MSRFVYCIVVGMALFAAPSLALDLTIGRSTEPTSMDPHFSILGNDSSTAENIFERLLSIDSNLQPHPGIATGWKLVDPLTWEISLRPGVRFHDGSTLAAEDVAFSLLRPRSIPNSPAPLTTLVAGVTAIEVIGPLSLRVRTEAPMPLLIEQIGQLFIIPAKTGPGIGMEDFNSGAKTIGTGPYRFIRRVPADRVELIANPDWWQGQPAYERVILKFISNDAGRIAALLSGAVDVTERIPPTDISTLQGRTDITLSSIASTRVIYLAVDSDRDVSPMITDASGKLLDRNPLKDVRVRRALSMMINRNAIVERVLAGAGVAAGQMVPDGLGGHDPSLVPTPYDVEGAKKLLAEAGYPNGFGLTLHTSSNRVPKDGELGQALGQMFSRGGLRMAVEALPYNVYVGQATARKFSMFVFSYGGTMSSSAFPLAAILHTNDPAARMGQLNRARYSNPAFDAALRPALAEFNAGKRNAMLAATTRIGMEDFGILPLYWQKLYWAARKGFVVTPDRGESTSVLYVAPAK